jgi:hypothetical protein
MLVLVFSVSCCPFRPLLDSFVSFVGSFFSLLVLVLSVSCCFFRPLPSLAVAFVGPFLFLVLPLLLPLVLSLLSSLSSLNSDVFFFYHHSKRQASASGSPIRHPFPTHHHTNQRIGYRAHSVRWGVVHLC